MFSNPGGPAFDEKKNLNRKSRKGRKVEEKTCLYCLYFLIFLFFLVEKVIWRSRVLQTKRLMTLMFSNPGGPAFDEK